MGWGLLGGELGVKLEAPSGGVGGGSGGGCSFNFNTSRESPFIRNTGVPIRHQVQRAEHGYLSPQRLSPPPSLLDPIEEKCKMHGQKFMLPLRNPGLGLQTVHGAAVIGGPPCSMNIFLSLCLHYVHDCC